MSPDAETVESLTALYMSQSPAAFTSIAMQAKQPNDYSKRVDSAKHEGDTGSCYCCCNEKGCCKSPWWYAIFGAVIVVCCCCCYYLSTNGFNEPWPYWPN
jgi:hypothetical protein